MIFPIFLFSQNKIQGIVISNSSNEPLAFANIVFNKNYKLTVATDIDGKFSFISNQTINHLTCSYVGFDNLELDLTNGSNKIIISLKNASNTLDEVLVKKGENPANRIIKKVIENKELNNPENISAFKYTSYNKSNYRLIYNKISKKDSLKFIKFLKNGPILVTENVTEKKYIKPDILEEVIIANKVSGF